MNKTCETCRYWTRLRVTDFGACRRYAPRNIDERHYVLPSAVWPETHGSFWCGEWAEKDPAITPSPA